MTAVVLRCPHCGTTRASPGECEACHEADVRYYCTNHSPGRWLDAPACSACGARFGVAGRPPAPRPAPSPARAPAPGRGRRSPPAGATPPPRPLPRAPEERGVEREEAAWPSSRGGTPDRGDAPRPLNPWVELLRQAERRRREHAARRSAEPRRGGGPRLGGCLLQLVFMGLLLLFALVSGFFLFAGSLFQLFRFF